jgi:hypothetical protein
LSTTQPIPGYPGYTIAREGIIYYKGQMKILLRKPGRAVKVRIRQGGITKELGVATLLAQAFLPNPHHYSRIIFKDGNKHNCTLDNIQWVSNREFVRRNLFPGKSLDIKAKPCKPRVVKVLQAEPPAEVAAVELPAFPGYYISPQGNVYHHAALLRPHGVTGKSLTVQLRFNGTNKYMGLAKLIAQVLFPILPVITASFLKTGITATALQVISPGPQPLNTTVIPSHLETLTTHTVMRKKQVPRLSQVSPVITFHPRA